jgi:hypothetical protein
MPHIRMDGSRADPDQHLVILDGRPLDLPELEDVR